MLDQDLRSKITINYLDRTKIKINGKDLKYQDQRSMIFPISEHVALCRHFVMLLLVSPSYGDESFSQNSSFLCPVIERNCRKGCCPPLLSPPSLFRLSCFWRKAEFNGPFRRSANWSCRLRSSSVVASDGRKKRRKG